MASWRLKRELIHINKITKKTINNTLLVGAILGVIALVIGYSDYQGNIFLTRFIIDASIILILFIVYLFRNRLPEVFKATAIIFGLTGLIFVDILAIGVHSENLMLIIIIPFYAFLVFSLRTTIVITLILIVAHIVAGFFIVNKGLVLFGEAREIEPTYNNWLVQSLLIFLVSFVIVNIINNYQKGFIRLIGHLKDKNNQLAQSEERYKKLINSFPDIVMIYDLEGNIVFANENHEKITGIKEKDFFNKDRISKIHPEDFPLVMEKRKELLDSNKERTEQIEHRFIDADGELHWFSGTMTKLYLDGKLFIQTVTRDITEKKKIELELEKHQNHLETIVAERTAELEKINEELILINEELSEKNEIINNKNDALKKTMDELKEAQTQLIQSEKMASLGVLTAGVAHEINNPLNYIRGGCSGLEAYLEETDQKKNDEVKILLKTIETGVERASNIVSSLNHFSRSSEDFSEYCDLNVILDNCLNMLHNKLKNRVEVMKSYGKLLNLKGNAGKLHQVFVNLFTNSCQAIEDKGTISIRTYMEGKNNIVEIEDTGIGIKDEHISKITDPFFTTKEPGEGTGLGLSISYNIIKEHKGKMKVESKPEKGTKFIIFLPVN